MEAGLLEFLPGIEGVLAEGLALFLALDVLDDGFPHHPVGRAVAGLCQVLDFGFGLWVEFDRDGFEGGGHGRLLMVLRGNTIIAWLWWRDYGQGGATGPTLLLTPDVVDKAAHLDSSWQGRRIQPSNALWRVFCCGHANALGGGEKGLPSPVMALHFWPRPPPVAQ